MVSRRSQKYFFAKITVVFAVNFFFDSEKDPVSVPALGNRNAQYEVLGEESAESGNETIAS